MTLKNIMINLFFEKENAPRRRIDDIERELSDYFVCPFTIVTIPNEAPSTIPRITARNSLGNEMLNISQINLQYIISFSDHGATNAIDFIDNYYNVILKLYNIVKNTLKKETYYFGITCTIEKEEIDPIKYIKDKHLRSLKENIDEINLRYALVEGDKYYVNTLINNAKEAEIDLAIKPDGNNEINLEILSTSKLKVIKHAIQASIDVNDRYSFNLDEKYRTSEEEILLIIKRQKKKSMNLRRR